MWIGLINIIQMSVPLLRSLFLIYKYNVIPQNIPISCYLELDKLIVEFIWKRKRARIARKTLKKKSYERGLDLPAYKEFNAFASKHFMKLF